MWRVLTICLCLLSTSIAQATHLRAGQITLKKQSTLTYIVTLKLFTNTGSQIIFGGGTLNFGDGTTFITPNAVGVITSYSNTGMVEFSISHTFPASGRFLVSYAEPNLNFGVINIANSGTTKFYLESEIIIESGRDSSSPDFLTDPFSNHPLSREYSLSSQAVDVNDNQLTYDLVAPLPEGSSNFIAPENLKVNHFNGSISWDTKYENALRVGEFLFGVRVTQYDSQGRRVGYVNRVFQAILVDSNSSLQTAHSVIAPNNKVFVGDGMQKKVKVLLADNSTVDELKWDIFFDQKVANHLTFTQYDSSTSTQKIKVGLLTINTTTSVIRDNPYSITLRGTSTSGTLKYSKDISYLFFTKDLPFPVITNIPSTETELKVFPNPFSHLLYVKCTPPGEEIETILMDISGKIILHTKAIQETPIDGSGLSPGMYILLIRSGPHNFIQKVVRR